MLTFICINLDRERLIHFGSLPMTQTILDSARLNRTQFDSLEHHWPAQDPCKSSKTPRTSLRAPQDVFILLNSSLVYTRVALKRSGAICNDLERSGATWSDLDRSGASWGDLGHSRRVVLDKKLRETQKQFVVFLGHFGGKQLGFLRVPKMIPNGPRSFPNPSQN